MKPPCLLNDLRNFNKILKKDVTYYNVKNHKIEGFHSLSLENTFLRKRQEGVK